MLQEIDWLLYEEESLSSDDEADRGQRQARPVTPPQPEHLGGPPVEAWGVVAAPFTPLVWNKMVTGIGETRECNKRAAVLRREREELVKAKERRRQGVVELWRRRENLLFGLHDGYERTARRNRTDVKRIMARNLADEVASLHREIGELNAVPSPPEPSASPPPTSHTQLHPTHLTTLQEDIYACDASATRLAATLHRLESLERQVAAKYERSLLQPLQEEIKQDAALLSKMQESLHAARSSARQPDQPAGQKPAQRHPLMSHGLGGRHGVSL